MTVLAVTPGETSGWALLNARGTVIACGSSPASDVGDVVDSLVRLSHTNGASVQAVVQRTPPTDLEAEFAARMTAMRLDVFDVRRTVVGKADCDRSAAARDFPYPDDWDGRPLTADQRAAIALAAYYLKPGPQLRKTIAGTWSPWREDVPRVKRSALPR